MGATVCRAVADDPGTELVAAVDAGFAGSDIRSVAGVDSDLVVAQGSDAFVAGEVDVVVDFSVHAASVPNLMHLAEQGIHAVVGTTGYSEDEIDSLRAAFTRSNCIIAPNFAIGAVLMMHFAAAAAPYFDSAEIIELHHDAKVDAPSGTALATVERMAEASAEWSQDPTRAELLEGARGGEGPAGIRVHSVRLRGLVAHQEVLLGTTGQTLSIRHDSIDRTSFMPGVLLAVKQIASHPGLTLGLDPLLGL